MGLLDEYRGAQRDEEVARLRRVMALRAMLADGLSQRQAAEALDVSQPAVSQQLKLTPRLSSAHPELLVEAAAPVIKSFAESRGYSRLAIFGSVARHEARDDSDIDFLVEAPAGTSSFAFLEFKRLIEGILDREVDLVEYGGLKPRVDDDIRRDAVLL